MVEIRQSGCDQCGVCIAVCPANALLIVNRLAVDAGRCTDCGRCAAVCPYGALSLPLNSAEEKEQQS